MKSSSPLTFFVELPADQLSVLFTPDCVEMLASEGYAISMAMLDFSEQRAKVIRDLEDRGIPVTAWLLHSEGDGYFFNAENANLGLSVYQNFLSWVQRYELSLKWVGLDLEPPLRWVRELTRRPVWSLLKMIHDRESSLEILNAEAKMEELVSVIHKSGRKVETYLVPLLIDERLAGSDLVRRVLKLVNVPADREVYMIYRSYLGVAAVRSYTKDFAVGSRSGQSCEAGVGVGCTGGGLDAGNPKFEQKLFLDQDELIEELAALNGVAPYVFSLEGCTEKNMMPSLGAGKWGRQSGLSLRQRAFCFGIGYGRRIFRLFL